MSARDRAGICRAGGLLPPVRRSRSYRSTTASANVDTGSISIVGRREQAPALRCRIIDIRLDVAGTAIPGERCRCPVAVPGECPCRRSGCVPRRPLPLAQVAPPATGGAPLAPRTRWPRLRLVWSCLQLDGGKQGSTGALHLMGSSRSRQQNIPTPQGGRDIFGAGDRTRTGTPSLAADFESATSTISSHRRVCSFSIVHFWEKSKGRIWEMTGTDVEATRRMVRIATHPPRCGRTNIGGHRRAAGGLKDLPYEGYPKNHTASVEAGH